MTDIETNTTDPKKNPTLEEKEISELFKQYEKVHDFYRERSDDRGFNALIYGEMGTGKTHMIQTCPRPIWVDSFDPGGTKTLRNFTKEDGFFFDTRFEEEDETVPIAFARWKKEFDIRRKTQFFNQLGTYVIDSSTMFVDAIMNQVLKNSGRSGTPPQIQDYNLLKIWLRSAIKVIASFDCNFILTGHIAQSKDDLTGKIHSSVMVPGQLKTFLPTLFDEVYVSIVTISSRGPEYRILTRPNGVFVARTRLGTGGVFELYEEPDIRKLLKKANLPFGDKPIPKS